MCSGGVCVVGEGCWLWFCGVGAVVSDGAVVLGGSLLVSAYCSGLGLVCCGGFGWLCGVSWVGVFCVGLV